MFVKSEIHRVHCPHLISIMTEFQLFDRHLLYLTFTGIVQSTGGAGGHSSIRRM